MAILDWTEIRDRAIKFSAEWKDETNENAEAKSFWNDFFNIFGISRRRVATFEERVSKLEGTGFIDLLWKGVLLIEHKSRGKDLNKAYNQAIDYFPGLKESELPKYILVSDFERFALHDLETGAKREFELKNLHKNIELFGFIAGYQKQEFKEQDPVNIQAAEKMAKLHDGLKEAGYVGHELEVYLVRLLFCLFADDTGIFEKNIFRDYIEQHTKEDGSDLAMHLHQIFAILDTPREKRMTTLSEALNQFPYVNGKLFEEILPPAAFNKDMRELFLECCILDWGKISPAIFGSMFQGVMKPDERRSLGAHYTSEKNILKVIEPLFMNDLRKEFEACKGNIRKLEEFHEKLSTLTFLDPACGCGNFLIIAYRELRLLEIEVLREITTGQMAIDLGFLLKVNVDQFYGIEIDEFPAQIAQVALWLMDHQMNMMAGQEFGMYYTRLPLTKKANVQHANALEIDWESVISSKRLSYILGNPPFIGSSMMSKEQKEAMKPITKELKSAGGLDFVCAWYIKAAQYVQYSNTLVGLVSTNSVVQGEQAIVLWKYLFKEKRMTIHFAHQTFKWTNEARGNAAVFCIIVGFSAQRDLPKHLYSYPDISGEPTLKKVKNINQYLLESPTIFIEKRRKPISEVPEMLYGTKPVDGGNYLFTKDEMEAFLLQEPQAQPYFKIWIGAQELTNSTERYCLYLKDCPPGQLKKMPLVLERVNNVRAVRLESDKKSTKEWANYPTHFTEDRYSDSNILIVPRVTSEKRPYVPIGFYQKGTICSDAAFQVSNATPYLFGLLNSSMHMAWLKTVGGRLKSDFRYSNTLVYNNFIFPNASEEVVDKVEKVANEILELRKNYINYNNTLADLYSPLTMPQDLRKAHNKLDAIVDKAYGRKFKTEEERVVHLLSLYTELTS